MSWNTEPKSGTTFYLIKKELYEKCMEKAEDDDSLKDLPKRVLKKVKIILSHLFAAKFHWTLHGIAYPKHGETMPGGFNVI